MRNVLICGAGGFIGGHLTKRLLNLGVKNITCVDIKPLEYWFQLFDECNNFSFDLKDSTNCFKITKNIDYIFNMACNMGGMGFIENNKAECMLSVLINTNLLLASKENRVKKYFFSSSACVYNSSKQVTTFVPGLKEEDAYPADPEDGYGWEKLFSERMCHHFNEDFKIETRVARFHNVYGEYGTFDGGREKAPAALSRKIIHAKMKNNYKIDIWGDGEQTRSFLYIDDCIDAVLKLFESSCTEVLNIGSEEQVSINELVNILEKISKIKVQRNYQLDKPKGVRGRSSDNTLVSKELGWVPKVDLYTGISKTFKWIEKEIKSGTNTLKFSRR